MKKIVFFVQTKKAIGGSQIQFLDFAAYIADHYDYQTYYINHPHPIVEKRYIGSKIHFVDVDNCDYTQFEDALFFTPINYLFYLLVKIEQLKNARILLYVYHPDVLDWLQAQIYSWDRKGDKLYSFYQLLIDTKSYSFMDYSNYLSLKRRVPLLWEERYIPVTIHEENDNDLNNLPALRAVNKKEALQIGWMGRLDNDKVYSIINAADNLVKYEDVHNVDFHLIGDGNARAKFSIKKYSPKIRFIFSSYLYGEERDAYIRENIDIMIAMGISAIDSAMLEVPTVVPIVSAKAFWSDVYVFVQNINKYSLGWNISDLEDMECTTYTLSEIINKVYFDENNKMKIGRDGRDFCIKNFSLSNASALLVQQIEQTELTVEKCLKNWPIKRQLLNYKLYKKIRPMRDYPIFHEFVAKTNRRVKKIFLKK